MLRNLKMSNRRVSKYDPVFNSATFALSFDLRNRYVADPNFSAFVEPAVAVCC